MSNQNLPITNWPLILTPAPNNPILERTQGQNLSLTIRAIPDPNYPSTLEGPPGTPAPILPPQPVVYSISVTSSFGNFWTITSDHRVVINIGSNRIFPLDNVTLLLENDSTVNFTTEQQVRDFAASTPYKFMVTSCVPRSVNSVDIPFTVTATGNSINSPVSASYVIRINSSFPATQQLLRDLMVLSRPYIQMVQSNIPEGAPPQSLAVNTSERGSNSDLDVVDDGTITQTAFENEDFNLDNLIVDDPNKRSQLLTELDNQDTEKSLIEMIKERVQTEPSLEPLEDDCEDCWCDPELGIDEIKRRINKWRQE